VVLCRVSGQLARYEAGKAGKTKQAHLHAIAAREDFISQKLTPKLAQQLKVSPPLPPPTHRTHTWGQWNGHSCDIGQSVEGGFAYLDSLLRPALFDADPGLASGISCPREMEKRPRK